MYKIHLTNVSKIFQPNNKINVFVTFILKYVNRSMQDTPGEQFKKNAFEVSGYDLTQYSVSNGLIKRILTTKCQNDYNQTGVEGLKVAFLAEKEG